MDKTRDHEYCSRIVPICRKSTTIACDGNGLSDEVLPKHTIHRTVIETYSEKGWKSKTEQKTLILIRASVLGPLSYLIGRISMKSKMMPIAALSVTEAKLFAGTCCAQEMLFETRVLESMGLKVKKPMILEVDMGGPKTYVITGAPEEEFDKWK
jgi:uncharacterized protein YabE (DUF348 family)